MTEAKKNHLAAKYNTQKSLPLGLPYFEDNSAFVAHVGEQLRRLPAESRINAMVEILAILDRYVRVQDDTL